MTIEQLKQLQTAKLLAIGFFLLLLNSAYLAATADPSIFYMANVLLHLVLGCLLTLVFLFYLIGKRRSLPPLSQLGVIGLLVGAALGMILIRTGAAQSYRWLLQAHMASAVAGSLLLALDLYRRASREDAAHQAKLAWKFYAPTLVFALLFPAAALAFHYYHSNTIGRIVNPPRPPSSMLQEGGGSDSPFFPSSAETSSGATIPSNFFLTSQTCKRCHQDIYNQWFSSAHHFSSFNNQWYRKTVEYMQDVVGTKPSKWCAGCHDHALLFNGMMETPIKQIIQAPESQAGLACTSCHSIVRVKSSMGNGDFVIEYPPLHDLAVSDNALMQKLHDFLVRIDPQPHKKVFMKPFMRQDTAQYCSACHKVHLDAPVNTYRWIRGFNEYDNWQASGVSGQGARSFYYPPEPQNCTDCHMPLVESDDPAAIDGRVHSHRFPGANTALPVVNRDEEQLRVVEEFLKAGHLTVDIFALSQAAPLETGAVGPGGATEPELASTFAVGEEAMNFGAGHAVIRQPVELTAPVDKVDAAVRRGDTVRIDVVVRTRTVGHFFPGGTVDAFDVWLELQAVDERGRVIFWSGMVEDGGRGPVEKGAHFYRSLLLDERGNPINKRNAWAARSVVYVRLIPPGAADTAHFRLKIPDDCGDALTLTAKLNYRKFSWWNTHWAFAGVRDPEDKDFALGPGYDSGRWIFTGDTSHVSGRMKAVPDLPIVVMAKDLKTIKVVNHHTPLPPTKPTLDPSDRERWNDYGIGLLLQGDLKGAERAFLNVTRIDPDYADGWVNIGRARLQEGDTAGAQEVLRTALSLDPELAKTRFFYALTLKSQGRYDEALQQLRQAAEQYPRDRVVRNQIGRLLFLQRRYTDAVAEFQKTLQVDPEDLQAHYNLMLCYRGLGDREMAEQERQFYLRFKADESAQFITGRYRQLHPEDNNERQPIHEHLSAPLEEITGPQNNR